jgi:hypothetical protein
MNATPTIERCDVYFETASPSTAAIGGEEPELHQNVLARFESANRLLLAHVLTVVVFRYRKTKERPSIQLAGF